MTRGAGVTGRAGKKPSRKAATRRASKTARRTTLSPSTEDVRVQLNKALEQQTATSDVLRIIANSPQSVQPVFDAIVANAARLCDATFSAVATFDGELLHLVAVNKMTPAKMAVYNALFPRRPNRTFIMGRAFLDGKPVHVEDIEADPDYDPHTLTVLKAAAPRRTFLGVPIQRDGVSIGVIGCGRREVRPFTEAQIALVKNFADQAAIAIENARLFEAEQQRTRELSESLEQHTATSEVLKVISSSPGELQPVFQALLENAVRICGAKFGMLFLSEGDGFRTVATHDVPPAFAEKRNREPLAFPPAESPLGRATRTRQVAQVADIRTESSYGASQGITDLANLGDARTVVAVPMLKENELVGAISIYHQKIRPFTDKQIELVQNFAAQAVIAIENTRLLKELRQRTDDLTESLEQQTATSEVLQVISSSPGELRAVFQTMLENATRICEAKYGMLYLVEEDGFRTVAMHNVPPALAEVRRSTLTRPPPSSPIAIAARTKRPAHVNDVRDQQAYVDRNPHVVASVELGRMRTVLAIPMLKEDQLVGVISIYRQEVRLFSDKQIELVQNFAAQAVIAIENTKLLNELRTRTNELAQSVGELQALGEVSQAVNSTLKIEAVLATIVGRAVQLSRTDAGAIYVFDEDRKEFSLHATYGMSETMIAAISGQHIGLDDGNNIATATTQRKPVQVADMRDEPASAVNEIVLREGYRSLLIIPLLRPDQIGGALVVRRKTPGEFLQSTIDLLQTFADQSVVAIQNARLYENVEARTRELAASLEDLRATQDRLVQTQKLASLGQLTAGIAHEIKNPLNFINNFSGVSVELIDELQETLGHINADDKTLAEIRELTNTLRSNLDKVVQHGKRADAIVKNMLLHSREGSGEHRPVDINALVEESLNLAYHGARAEKQGFNITLERSLDPAAGEADVFPQDITRVLLNLISNGFYAATKRKAEADGGEYEPALAASSRDLGDRVEIRIRDNGTGIPPEVKEKMFNPFFTTKPAGEGTGLGLSISHDIIIKQHGGSIEVDTQPGEYTEIKITLPRLGVFPTEKTAQA